MQAPRVTAIIDNYNQGRFVAAAIESALSQTRPCAQVIVVDDGSTDASREVIASFGDRVEVVHKPNGGQASAFNAGFARAKGDVVALLDADDVWLPGKVEALEKAARADPGAVMFYHRYRRLSEDGRAYGLARPRGLWRGDIASEAARLGGMWANAPTSGSAYARSFLDRVMPIPEEDFRIAADVYLFHLAPFFGRVVALPDVLMGYRVHGANLWNSAEGRAGSDAALRRSIEMSHRHKARVNEALAKAGVDHRVRSEDDFLYLRARYAAGDAGPGLWRLARKALAEPVDPSLAWRAAALARLVGDARARRRRARAARGVSL